MEIAQLLEFVDLNKLEKNQVLKSHKKYLSSANWRGKF
nr:MAG TPA: hypothetical protein [Caudoviricetes sp.]